MSASQAASGPIGSPGFPLCVEIDNLQSCTTYYVALRTRDEAYNWSLVSNAAGSTTRCSGTWVATCDGTLGPASHETTPPGQGNLASVRQGQTRAPERYSSATRSPVRNRSRSESTTWLVASFALLSMGPARLLHMTLRGTRATTLAVAWQRESISPA
jgi:hypothetical protein